MQVIYPHGDDPVVAADGSIERRSLGGWSVGNSVGNEVTNEWYGILASSQQPVESAWGLVVQDPLLLSGDQ
jgi:hypothetical protein